MSRGDSSSDDGSPRSTGSNTEGGDAVMVIARAIYNLRFFFVIAWPALTVVMAPLSWLTVQNAAPIVKQPPRNTESTEALGVFEHHFQDLAIIRREMVEIRCRFPCVSAATDLSRGYVEQIQDLVERFGNDNPGTIVQVNSFFTFHGHHQIGENPMISQNHQAILVQWLWRMTPDKKAPAEEFIQRMSNLVYQINKFQGPDGFNVSISGLVSLDHAMKETLIEEIPVHEMGTIWMPFIILAIALQSVRLLILALIPMPIEILVAIGAMYFVSLHTTVLFYALMMMLMLCTSLSFDYALFTLTRYSEERATGADVREAILTVISQSGRVVVVSGCVLMIAWGAMLALPNPFKSFCVCANSMILTCVLVQLTFTPSLLAILPFLGPPASKPLRPPEPPRALEDDDSPLKKPLGNGSNATGSSHGHRESPLAKARPHMRGMGFAMGRWLTLFPLNIIVPIIVYVVMMPLTLRMGQNFTLSTFKFRMGHSYALTVPRTRNEWHTALRVQRDFPNSVGILMPMLIIATNSPQVNMSLTDSQNLRASLDQYPASTTPKPVDVQGQPFFDANCHMANSLIQATKNTRYNLTADSFVSATFHGAGPNGVQCLEYQQINWVRTNFISRNVLLKHTSKNLQMLWHQLVSKGHHAMLTFLFPTMDPFSPDAFELVKVMRASLRQLTLEGQSAASPIPGLTFMTFSPASILMDLIDVTSVRLPMAFVGCVLVCLVLIAAWFGAIFIPLKLLLTVVVPITWTYGAALYVYEDGALNWTGFSGVMPTGNAGIDWTVPMFTLTFIVGLALDYEIFLIERIREFREEGFGDRESIQLGLAATSGTITCAGLIMALTFIAQMLGSIPVTNQMGFILVFSIVTDTFIVRTVLVPAMLSLVPCANYWPSKMPRVRYEWLSKGLTAPPDNRSLASDPDWDEDEEVSDSE